MTIANVALTNTFDEWRIKTNQLIGVYQETNTLAIAAYNSTNTVTFTAANLAAEVLASNTIVLSVITDTVNTALPDVLTTNTQIITLITETTNTIVDGFLANTDIVLVFDTANAAFEKANSTTLSSNVVISVADDFNAALRITQTGNGDALIVEDSDNPDATPFVISATGNVGIGTASPGVKLAISSTDAILIPVGSTDERPAGANGYLRFNDTLSQFEGYNGTEWGSIGGGGGATGGSTDKIFHLNEQVVTSDYIIPDGQNAGTFGPISINDGVTVTIPANSTWSVI